MRHGVATLAAAAAAQLTFRLPLLILCCALFKVAPAAMAAAEVRLDGDKGR
jgi:hypothetical protein